MNHDQIRQDQNTEARRRLTVAGKKPFVAKGHDAILKGVQDSKGNVIITTIGDGTEHFGMLIARDKYTITIKLESGSTKTFYKHAIESFEPVQVQ